MNKPVRSRNAAFAQTWPAGVSHEQADAEVSSVCTLRVKVIGANDQAAVGDASMPADDRSYQALAYARTLPAIPLDALGVEDSGIREIRRLQLWLHPRDSVPSPEQRDGTPTLRVHAASRGRLARAWEAWEQQSPGMTIFTATVLCVISVLAVSLFAH